MSNEVIAIQEQLKGMEERMVNGFAGLKNDVSGLKTDVKELKEGQEKYFTALKADLDSIQSDVQRVENDVQRVEKIAKGTFDLVQDEREEHKGLGGRVGILEEEMVLVKGKVGLKAVKMAME